MLSNLLGVAGVTLILIAIVGLAGLLWACAAGGAVLVAMAYAAHVNGAHSNGARP